MKAHDIMISPVYKVKESDNVEQVIQRFIDHRISGLPVVNERNEIVGYISDGDIMRYIGKKDDMFIYTYAVNLNYEEYEDRVKQIMKLNVMSICKKKVITVSWNEDIEIIASILGKKQIKKLPVHRNGVLAGIISRGDVIRHSFQSLL
ncbi:CBS domain-containing protein [Paenibacillus urinalis]|uniref:CBS domain-containing protein n=1 Tax=Paenibacillus urinalis TaxID=521520 RepID=A0AAX3N7U1_9BACL|nr:MULTISPECIES: CBS domain-containing protein [Paenibacillus]WDH84825.1 CBS domain-containing protein [Paenibacillus urinalis]WDH96284.1 CBS domain-containing protein [Paenibacillus urinalis]WDI04507.1 CBS domain-containing protein [Paenibacillus urinalis]GAK43214.1 CBS domain-containing protein [Paenibacillus sp. TCA20]